MLIVKVLCRGCRESVDNTLSCSYLEPVVRKVENSQIGGDQAIGFLLIKAKLEDKVNFNYQAK